MTSLVLWCASSFGSLARTHGADDPGPRLAHCRDMAAAAAAAAVWAATLALLIAAPAQLGVTALASCNATAATCRECLAVAGCGWCAAPAAPVVSTSHSTPTASAVPTPTWTVPSGAALVPVGPGSVVVASSRCVPGSQSGPAPGVGTCSVPSEWIFGSCDPRPSPPLNPPSSGSSGTSSVVNILAIVLLTSAALYALNCTLRCCRSTGYSSSCHCSGAFCTRRAAHQQRHRSRQRRQRRMQLPVEPAADSHGSSAQHGPDHPSGSAPEDGEARALYALLALMGLGVYTDVHRWSV
jgi:hypothetical protein